MEKKKIFILAILIVCVIFVAQSISIIKRHNEYNDIARNIQQIESMRNEISDCLDWTVIKTDNGYIAHETGIRSASSKIKTYADVILMDIEDIDTYYAHIKPEIKNDVVKHETINNGMYKTWEEYKNSLTKKYYLDEDLTDYERANKIIKSYVDLKTR